MINKNCEPFSVRMKDFWDVTQAEALLGEKFAKTLLHEPDGLIFQPSAMVSDAVASLRKNVHFVLFLAI